MEGTNVLAVRVEDSGGARGFAAELRVDGTPFLPGRPASTWTLPKDLEQQLDDLARRLDADAFVVREAASAQLLALIAKHGELLRGKLEHLSRAGSAEVRSRVEQVLRTMPSSFPNLDNKAGDDSRLVYLRLTLEQFESLLKAEDEAEVLILRYLVPFRALAAKHEKAMGAFLVRLLDGASPVRAERGVGCISFLELRPLAPALADVVATRPRSPAGAAAASALGRLGDRSHEAVLKSVLQCGYLPTERAARHALMQLSSKELPPR